MTENSCFSYKFHNLFFTPYHSYNRLFTPNFAEPPYYEILALGKTLHPSTTAPQRQIIKISNLWGLCIEAANHHRKSNLGLEL